MFVTLEELNVTLIVPPLKNMLVVIEGQCLNGIQSGLRNKLFSMNMLQEKCLFVR